MNCAVIFGGTGFIGAFFASKIASTGLYTKIYIYDHESLADKPFEFRRKLVAELPQVSEVIGDLRRPLDWVPPERVELIANFAAVHREPGHQDSEYFETNIRAAENVCLWAEKVGCKKIVFTSSISPYGISEAVKDESTLPVPVTAYGSSKLVAEKIHLAWQNAEPASRRLVIARPGVVFGPGEGGNVTRMIKAVIGRYFIYTANKNTRKAGIYVKELCAAMLWVLYQNEAGVSLFNGSMNPGPSIQEYVEAVCKVKQIKRVVPTIPFFILIATAHILEFFGGILGIVHPFSPVRVRKLVRSNNIMPGYLLSHGYIYQYTLESAMADWMREEPSDWE